MYAWWAIRGVERAGWLTGVEWQLLVERGQPHTLRMGEQLMWGPGVLLLSQGRVQLKGAKGLYEAPAATLIRAGDIAGVHCGTLGTIFAETPSKLHLLPHSEWLRALWHYPQVPRNLLRGMAHAALQAEQQALPPD